MGAGVWASDEPASPRPARSRGGGDRCENKLQVSDPHCSAIENDQTDLAQQWNYLAKIEMEVRAWESHGWIRLEHGSITVLDRRALSWISKEA
jgi:hypothetical protein